MIRQNKKSCGCCRPIINPPNPIWTKLNDWIVYLCVCLPTRLMLHILPARVFHMAGRQMASEVFWGRGIGGRAEGMVFCFRAGLDSL